MVGQRMCVSTYKTRCACLLPPEYLFELPSRLSVPIKSSRAIARWASPAKRYTANLRGMGIYISVSFWNTGMYMWSLQPYSRKASCKRLFSVFINISCSLLTPMDKTVSILEQNSATRQASFGRRFSVHVVLCTNFQCSLWHVLLQFPMFPLACLVASASWACQNYR